ncbi:stalk domain-containing protein [Paenibacillus turpanensis]|uniref:stalk domain-containing protein n=1 Tax=Paenibacillus turpanensis TaxID=2689078 RepID=UPI00140E5FE1|nr:stalk domain-containing protein [Paenibacillus turpanensis]
MMIRKASLLAGLTAMLVGAVPVWAAASEHVTGSTGKTLLDVAVAAGSGTFEEKDANAQQASFRAPGAVAVGQDGSLVIADTRNHKIRKAANDKVTTYAGPAVSIFNDDKQLPAGLLYDGTSTEAFFQRPEGIAFAKDGSLYVADAGNHAVRKISGGKVRTLAGSGVLGYADAKGGAAQFYEPSDLAVTNEGVVYVADRLNHAIRKITPDGSVTTLNKRSERAVEVYPGYVVPAGDFKDGLLSEALFNEPSGLVLDQKGNLYVSDTGNQRIRYIDFTAGTVTTVAGGAKALADKNSLYAAGDYKDGTAADARFNYPRGLALDAEGGLIVADSLNHSIRYVKDGFVSTLAGSPEGEHGFSLGTESSARFNRPADVAVAADGTIYVADTFNNQVRSLKYYQLPEGLPSDGTISVALGSKLIAFDAKPELANNRTMVPVRFIAEAVGYEVTFHPNGNETIIRLSKGETAVELAVGRAEVTRTVNGEKTSRAIDAAPYIKDNRTYVPVRFFAEEIGLDVQWAADRQTVVLRTK